MSSLILRTSSRILFPILIVFAIFLLLRGHNYPGGGFVGGLVAAVAFALHAIAYNVESGRRLFRFNPHLVIGAGLLCASGSGIISLIIGLPYMTGWWYKLHLPWLGELDIGTPFFFDLGVFLTVLGVTLSIIFSLAEE